MASRNTDAVGFAAHGEVVGKTTTEQAIPTSVKGAKWVKFKADIANAGNVYLGLTGVTASAGSTTTTGGWPLSKGQETDWLPAPGGNLNGFHYICDNAGDCFSYIVLR